MKIPNLGVWRHLKAIFFYKKGAKKSCIHEICRILKVHLEIVWTSKQMIMEGKAAIPLETTRRAFRNKEQSKQRSTIVQGVSWLTEIYKS